MESQFEYTKLQTLITNEPELKKLNKARLKLLCYLITSLIKVQKVGFRHLSEGYSSGATVTSNMRRIQRFFAKFEFPEKGFSRLIVRMIPVKGRFRIAIDRTNWKFGKRNINLLFLCVVYQGVGIPLMWKALGNKRGNSSTAERIDLLERFVEWFGADMIEHITADREFIGEKWWTFLMEHGVPFYIRIKENSLFELRGGKFVSARRLFAPHKLKVAYFHPTSVKIAKVKAYVSGMKYVESGKLEYLILASPRNTRESLEIYRERWQIETMFRGFKSAGFNLEDTHLKDYERINKLLYVIAIAFIWSYNIGVFKHEKEKPIKIKKHGRRAKSFFSYGLEQIAHALINKVKTEIERLSGLFLSCT
ncbi:IS4 family transposase [Fulvitalea axinellae]|uniref:IS4 family transposase n=1 Tax=Fulvitalea axinellae TaxID=1182444 RepID=A0AAU9CZP5_9BACT|nr:IS4 family transposase [Fulvitalea axinellae]